ncbi:hypothetical protein OG618_06410 [Kitasatospora sp. NBC_01246]|uniref:hypothetical protein n=1 Tax=Kitasatospora sp. NBC_01246 TaxID=2903570 RepID=UPI002E34A6C8|nr:hypothetical protein [Kitasatospora sp. NBC_01246]
MAGQARRTAAGRRRGTAGLAVGALALLLAVAGCSSSGTAAAPSAAAPSVRPTEPATPTPTPTATSAVPSPPAAVPSASAPGAPPEPSEAPGSVYGCDGQPLISPKSLELACDKGASMLDGLVWTAWGGLSPTATGRLWEKNAAGGVAAVPATVTLGGLTGGDYTTMRISAPKAERPNLTFTLSRSGPAPKD